MEVNLGLLIANQPRTLSSKSLIGFVDTLLTSSASEILPNWCRIIPSNTSNVIYPYEKNGKFFTGVVVILLPNA